MKLDADRLFSHVAGHAGVSDELARHATKNVMAGLGARLDEASRVFVSEELPETVSVWLSIGNVALPIEELVLMPSMTAGHARELVASVCHVLAETLSPEAISMLRDAAPAWIAGWLAAPAAALTAPPAEPRRYPTLAGGRSGSEHPLAESVPHRVQDESLAAANPHGPTKLSSSDGTTQVRDHDTLADAHTEEPHLSERPRAVKRSR